MGSVDNKSLIWIPVENNSCSSCLSYEITVMWYIIKIISCNKSIDDVDSHTPYFYVFLWRYCYMPDGVRNVTTQPILSSAGNDMIYW